MKLIDVVCEKCGDVFEVIAEGEKLFTAPYGPGDEIGERCDCGGLRKTVCFTSNSYRYRHNDK